jgi:tripartite ATP-independent transporter DctM subunit
VRPETVGIAGIVLMLVFMFGGMWVGLAMALVGFAGCVFLGGMDKALLMLGGTVYHTLSSYTLTVIPMFVLMSTFIARIGISSDLFAAAHKWLGHIRGGIAIATIYACAIFAAICGSSFAETLAIAKVALPEMRKRGYSEALSCGCVACGGTLGILIPPSLGFVAYAMLTEQSVGHLFMAGVLPGILLSALFIVCIMVISYIDPKAAPPGEKTPFREKILSLRLTGPALILILLVLGGIYVGIFTPTEAGAIGVCGAFFIALVSKRFTWQNFVESLWDTVQTTGSIIVLLVGAYVFSKFMNLSNLPNVMCDFIGGLGISKYMVFAVVVIIYLIIGMFMDILSAIVVTVPIIYPVMVSLGFDPIWFGVIVVLLMEAGLVTPPVGMNVFVLSSSTSTPMNTIFRGVWPFVAAIVVCIVILALFPEIALFLPSRM